MYAGGIPPCLFIQGVVMKKYISIARENIATYSSISDVALIDLQHIIAAIIGTSATPELCGRLSKDGVKGLLGSSIYDLENAGLTHLEAIRLHSAILLATKLLDAQKSEKSYIIRSPEDSADFLMKDLRYKKQEHLVALFLDTKNKVIHKKTVFIGSLNSSIVHPREIFKNAMKYSSASIIIAHNHPSGDPMPSKEDIQVTKRLVEVGRIVGIELLDHIIIGDGNFVSLKEKGYI